MGSSLVPRLLLSKMVPMHRVYSDSVVLLFLGTTCCSQALICKYLLVLFSSCFFPPIFVFLMGFSSGHIWCSELPQSLFLALLRPGVTHKNCPLNPWNPELIQCFDGSFGPFAKAGPLFSLISCLESYCVRVHVCVKMP